MKPAVIAISALIYLCDVNITLNRIVVHAYCPTRIDFARSFCESVILSTIRTGPLPSQPPLSKSIALRPGLRHQYFFRCNHPLKFRSTSSRSKTIDSYKRSNVVTLRLSENENSNVKEKDIDDINEDFEYYSNVKNVNIPSNSSLIIDAPYSLGLSSYRNQQYPQSQMNPESYSLGLRSEQKYPKRKKQQKNIAGESNTTTAAVDTDAAGMVLFEDASNVAIDHNVSFISQQDDNNDDWSEQKIDKEKTSMVPDYPILKNKSKVFSSQSSLLDPNPERKKTLLESIKNSMERTEVLPSLKNSSDPKPKRKRSSFSSRTTPLKKTTKNVVMSSNATSISTLSATNASNQQKMQSSLSNRKESIKKPTVVTNPNIYHIDESAPLTISDLQRILNQTGYLRREDVESIAVATVAANSKSLPKQSQKFTKSSPSLDIPSSQTLQQKGGKKSPKSDSKTVAFPQPSIISSRDLRIGSSMSSAFFCFLIFTSVRSNLWLIGLTLGAYYGNNIAEKAEQQVALKLVPSPAGVASPPIQPPGMYEDMVLKSGKRLAQTYLKIWDTFQGIWFMYRTGQLSYDYYKQYERLDSKFKLQKKVDAWNARFVEGKQNFDAWEKENEIGRKVLAGLRTVWMVNENSYKNQKFKYGKLNKNQSKYRLIRYGNRAAIWCKKFLHALWIAVTGSGKGELREIIQGMRVQLSELKLEVVSQRTGAAIAALVAVNLIGAMFAIAPSLLAFLAIMAGVIWPEWVAEFYQSFKNLMNQTRARGRGEKNINSGNDVEGRENIRDAKIRRRSKDDRNYNQSSATVDSERLVDINNFHYYIKEDGTKKWYRTGKSSFINGDERKSSDNQKDSLNFFGINVMKKVKTKGNRKHKPTDNRNSRATKFFFFRRE